MALFVYLPTMTNLQFPHINAPVHAGQPAENTGQFEWMSLDVFVSNGRKDETIYVRVEGTSMQDRGIDHGDMLIVHLKPVAKSGDVVLARIGGEYTVKNFHELEPIERKRRIYLVPSNPLHRIRSVDETDDFEIVGVVAYILKRP